MKRRNGILLGLVAVSLLALVSVVFAQEMMEKADTADVEPPWTGRGTGMGRMTGGRGRGMMRGAGHRAMRGPGGSMDRMGMLMHLADEIGVSEAQKEEISDLLTTHHKDMITKRAEKEIAEVDLRKLLQDENPDLDMVEDQIRKIANLEAQMRFSQIKTHVDVKNVLTEEQLEKLKEIAKDRRAKMREMRDDRPVRPEPGRGRRGRGPRGGDVN
jgi:Spy/CpxP family protein refolding chaperone